MGRWGALHDLGAVVVVRLGEQRHTHRVQWDEVGADARNESQQCTSHGYNRGHNAGADTSTRCWRAKTNQNLWRECWGVVGG